MLHEQAAALNIEVEGLEIMPDYVHLFVSVPSIDAAQYFANQFKTSRVLCRECSHPSLTKRKRLVLR